MAQQAAAISAGSPPFIPATLPALAVLVPIDFVLIALMQERGFTVRSVAPVALFLFVQSLTMAVLCGAGLRVPRLQVPIALPRYSIGVMASTGIYLCIRFLLNRKPVDNALLWSLGTFFVALRSAPATLTSMAYWVSSACILGTAVIENSYLLAYHDELTTLPSRRAFNDALLGLKCPYSIAVVDIDHFKRFNDTYGHDTGDEVLRMVAANLARVTGGGEAYRCGGEEFNILFPGKMTTEVLPHLEKLRENVEKAEFCLRGNERRQAPRGPDRRHKRSRSRSRKQEVTGWRAASNPHVGLSVTISIGVATAAPDESRPESVIKSADRALYRAKENGRNRVETTTFSTRRLRTKAAGIA
jgi:GGDEF domain-containing protein